MSIKNLQYIGGTALMNYQAAIDVHGNNTANSSTVGYSRRTVTFSSNTPTDTTYGQVGTGASLASITRSFNSYLERQYLQESSRTSRYATEADRVANVESLFVQVEDYGLAATLDNFESGWTNLAQSADDLGLRTELTTSAETLASQLQGLEADMRQQEQLLNEEIRAQVDEVNELLEQLADLNKDLAGNAANASLLDARDLYLRELAELVDIDVSYGEDGQVTVFTGEGQTLVNGSKAYAFALSGPTVYESLTPDSTFTGEVYFEGESSYEYTIEVVTAGSVTSGASGAGTAYYKVSLDGGDSWITDSNGAPVLYPATDYDHRVTIGEVSIYFGDEDDPSSASSTDLSAGDRSTIVAKEHLTWLKTTSHAVNVTPLTGGDGNNRLSGGSLVGLLTTRDEYLGSYQEEIDALAEELIWQTNYQHSQGASLSHYESTAGTYEARYTDRAIADSGLPFADRVSEGSFSFAIYDDVSGETVALSNVSFAGIVPPGQESFDPSVHTLEDVAQAINDSYGGLLNASIVDGKLTLDAADGYSFEFAGDSTGLMAACGLNTFYDGYDAGSIEVRAEISADPQRINAAHVNGSGMVEEGDNTTALALDALFDTTLTIATVSGSREATLTEYLAATISQVGADTAAASGEFERSYVLSADLYDRQQSNSGVNLDEELVNITMYEQAYQAASRLIQTASEMFDIVMSLKD